MKCRWQEGNRITLLENGDQYYPALFAAIGRASRMGDPRILYLV